LSPKKGIFPADERFGIRGCYELSGNGSNYRAIVRGANNSIGIAVVEMYVLN
jgi:hypothetical protein